MNPISAKSPASAEIDLLTRRLAESERELRTVLYAVSHDVRAPLRALDGFALALEEDYAARLDGPGLDYLARIRAGAKRMDKMISSVIALAKLQEKPLTSDRADLSHMANDILSGLREADPARVVQIRVDPGMVLTTDRILVRALLHELIHNSWKFTGEAPSASIRVSREEAPESFFAFSVADNGAGFDVARAGDRLFGLFQQFHPPGQFPGEGAGLALVWRATQLLGGTLRVESKPGEGAVFHCMISNPGRR